MAENKNAQQVREITDKLEQGIKELFESERFKEYLRTMSKFYNYSFNNTLLIAMQKPEATYVAGYTSWQRNFDRQVMKGEKGIKILAPAPYKTQEEREKVDPVTQKPVIGADGKAVTETVEVLRPAFKVVSVFDVSQTDGKESLLASFSKRRRPSSINFKSPRTMQVSEVERIIALTLLELSMIERTLA